MLWFSLFAPVGCFFACGIIVALYFDVRGWLRPHHTEPSAAPAADSHDPACFREWFDPDAPEM